MYFSWSLNNGIKRRTFVCRKFTKLWPQNKSIGNSYRISRGSEEPKQSKRKTNLKAHIPWFRNSLQSYSNQKSVVWCIDRHIDQWNRNNEPRYQLLHLQSNDFWQECQNNSIGERAIISINSGKTRYPHAKEWSWTFSYTVYKHYILKLDQKSQCRN